MRIRAIYNALKHGILPWWMYEDARHYDCSYWYHLWTNLQYAWRWITGAETPDDIQFETNNHYMNIEKEMAHINRLIGIQKIACVIGIAVCLIGLVIIAAAQFMA